MRTNLFKIMLMPAVVAFLTTSPLFTASSWAEAEAKRIVSIGGSITETLFALGQEKRLIARDSTSLFPQKALDLPDVGYIRRLSPEGVLSVNPDLILTLEGAGPPEAVQVLKAAGVPLIEVEESYDSKGVVQRILDVGAAVNRSEKAKILADSIQAQFSQLKTLTDSVESPKSVVFVLSLRGGKIMASGTNTAADGIIQLAGAKNAITNFEGYKALSDEAIINAAPDVIVMMDRRGDHSTTNEQVFAHPGIALTPAGKAERLVRMNGLYLLGFGPRTAEAAGVLHKQIYLSSSATQ
ncbi:MAG: ABC transporter substrate-binding protein [Pseudomonadota bacterium]